MTNMDVKMMASVSGLRENRIDMEHGAGLSKLTVWTG